MKGGGWGAPFRIFLKISLQVMFYRYPPTRNQNSGFWVPKQKFWLFSYGVSIILKRGGFGGPFWNFSKIQKTPRGVGLLNMVTKYELDACTGSWSKLGVTDRQTDRRTDRQTDRQSDYITRSASQACKNHRS